MLWINGEPVSHISALDRGLLYGDACFTTMACFGGEIEALDRHVQRLQSDASGLLMPAPDAQSLRDECIAFARGCGDGVIRCTLTRGEGGAGYAPSCSQQLSRLLHWRAFPPALQSRAEYGIEVRACTQTLALQTRLAGIKHCNRLEQILARAEWQDEAIAEGLMCSSAGHLVEGVSSNVFWCDAQENWYTPDLSLCGVAGVMRARLLDLMQQQAISCTQVRRELQEVLAQAKELFVCNSVIGIWPVIACGAQRYSIGAGTRRLQQWIGRGIS